MSMAHINALFAPRPAMPFQPPYCQQLGVKKMPAYTGIAAYLKEFESKEENDKNFETFKPIEQRKERRERIAEERTTMMKETLELKTANWNPQDYSFESDAYKTLFVGRLSFLTDEIKLKREFEQVNDDRQCPFLELRPPAHPQLQKLSCNQKIPSWNPPPAAPPFNPGLAPALARREVQNQRFCFEPSCDEHFVVIGDGH